MIAAATASRAATNRITSSTAIDCQAVSLVPATEYHGRNSATIMRTPEAPATHSPRLKRRGSTRGRLTRDGLAAGGSLEPGGLHRVHQQHRDRHRADATGDGSDRARLLDNGVEVHIPYQPVVGAVDADVDDDGAVADHLGRHQLRAADCCNEHVGTAAHVREVAGA